MRRGLLVAAAALAALPAAPAEGAGAPRVEVMVVGRTKVLRPATRTLARAVTVRVGAKRCAVASGTPLAALAALRAPAFHVRDFGACSRRARDAESLFVDRIAGERNRGVDGWVYKAGRRAPGVGGGAPAARVRTGTRVLWFWCRQGPRGCQRSLEVAASPTRVAPGAPVTFAVRGFDDRGRGVALEGATVRFAGAAVRTGPGGTAVAVAPASPGRMRASAEAAGAVPSFPTEVVVG